MMKTVKVLLLVVSLLVSLSSAAVTLNPKGVGEVLIYPYYSVRNGHNTYYSIVNSSDQAKALKLTFHEGLNGTDMLSFNVYLAPFDVWSGVLTAVDSTHAGHEGEPSVEHVTVDQSCSPFLYITGQEFLPYSIDPSDTNQSMERSTHGYLVVYELGVVTGASAAAMEPDNTGVPANCDALSDAWSSGYWFNDPNTDINDPTGGLYGSAMILNITGGYSMGLDAVALDDFWQGPGMHTDPGLPIPNLSHAAPVSVVSGPSGLVSLPWEEGIDAVSAVMMNKTMISQYDVNTLLSGLTEWVITYPTKSFYTNQPATPQLPFTDSWDGTSACEALAIAWYANNTLAQPSLGADICHAVNFIEVLPEGEAAGNQSRLLGANDFTTLNTIDAQGEGYHGWIQATNSNTNNLVNDNDTILAGLPGIGLVAKKYTNSSAANGLLAVYADFVKPTTKTTQASDFIFADGFESIP